MLNALIISPHFAPTNAPDMQRIRLLLPHFEKQGIRATVLSVSPDCVDFPQDAWLESMIPATREVHRVKAFGAPWRKIPGLGSLATRSFASLKDEGNRLLAGGGFDFIYFSTTQFGVHLLGPYWKEKFGIPFFMDFQDPWVNDYYREHPEIIPPGGRLKFAAADWFNRRAEPKVIRECCGITSVSPAYPRALQSRYPDLKFEPWSEATSLNDSTLATLVAPFPVEPDELATVHRGEKWQTIFAPGDGKEHWLYAGRCGDYMETSLSAIFEAIHQLRKINPGRFRSLCIHFVGTQYEIDPSGVSMIARLALDYGLDDLVNEHPSRIPYSEVLQCLNNADLLLVPGSDDPGYSASKIFPYLLADTPVLGVFHEDSSVVSITGETGGGLIIPFSRNSTSTEIVSRILERFNGNPASVDVPLNHAAIEPYSACYQSREMAAFFRACLARSVSETELLALTS